MRTSIPPQKEEISIFLEEWLNMEICELSAYTSEFILRVLSNSEH
jgi:hypothetical protein